MTTNRNRRAETSGAVTASVPSAVEQANAAAVQQRFADAHRYRELLAQNERAADGAGVELLAVAGRLGRTPADFLSDLKLVREIIADEPVAARVPEERAALDAARVVQKDALRKIEDERKAAEKRWNEETMVVGKKLSAASGAYSNATAAAQRLEQAQLEWGRRVGVAVRRGTKRIALGSDVAAIPFGSRVEMLEALRSAVVGADHPTAGRAAVWASQSLAARGYESLTKPEFVALRELIRGRVLDDAIAALVRERHDLSDEAERERCLGFINHELSLAGVALLTDGESSGVANRISAATDARRTPKPAEQYETVPM